MGSLNNLSGFESSILKFDRISRKGGFQTEPCSVFIYRNVLIKELLYR